MANITLRNTKGSPLTNTEVDGNFENLNTFKVELTDSEGSALIPTGDVSQRDAVPQAGMFRYNSELTQFEGYTTEWGQIGGGGVDVVDDTTTNSDAFYVTLSDQTSGSEDTLTVSSTKMYFNPSTGQLNATNFNSLSDIKYKGNVKTISEPTSKVMQLRGVNFNWIEDKRKSMGVIAQEIEKVIPEVVSTGEDKTVNYNAIIGLLIESIKEQNERIDELEKQLKK